MDTYSNSEQIKEEQGKKLNLFASTELQEIIRELKASKNVNLFTADEFSNVYLQILGSEFLKPFEKLFWGIHISANVKELYSSPPTSVAIWVDYDYTPHSDWKVNSNDIENLYVVHTKEELLEIVGWFIETLNESPVFAELYDNDVVASYIEQIAIEQLEE